MHRQLHSYVGTDTVVRIRRRIDGGDLGYLLDATEACLLLFTFDAFVPDGFLILRTADVVGVECEPKWTEMSHAEGHHFNSVSNPNIPIGSIKEAVNDIFSRGQNVRIECEDCGDAEEHGLHIGRVTAIQEDHIEFLYFDHHGIWFHTPYRIPYGSITRISVDQPYVNTFSKYVGPCPIERL